MVTQGGVGVILFFFLSGYILTIPYRDNPKKFFKNKYVLSFFINRIFRLVPAYIVIAGITAIVLKFNIDWYLWNISFIKGWKHYWSVAEEARFYLLFPLVLLLISITKNKWFQVLISIIIVYISFHITGRYKIDMFNGRYVSFYFFMFCGGMTTCLIMSIESFTKLLNSSKIKQILQIISFAILLSLILTSKTYFEILWRPLFPNIGIKSGLGWGYSYIWLILFAILFITTTYYEKGLATNIVNNYFLRHIGLLSYSIYLFHMLIIDKLPHIGLRSEGKFVVVLLFSYFYAILSYILIEKPFLNLKKVMFNKLHTQRENALFLKLFHRTR
jgi:peptidoglycan/LPS O-acetylase OafA/YrhL